MALRVEVIFLFLKVIFIPVVVMANRTIENQCGLYLAPSTVPGAGRGIIAGANYRSGEVVEIASTTAFLTDLMLDFSQLNNYVYAYDDDYSMMLFGAGSLYNHNKKSTVKHFWVVMTENLNKPSDYLWTPFNMGNDVWIRATEHIAAGEEIYAYYGEEWFDQRGMTEVDLIVHTPAEPIPVAQLDKYGHCLTDVGVGQSNVVFAGKGLFARKHFKAGDIVVISPVLTLSRSVVDKTNGSSAIVNFCFTLADNVTEVVLFPLNNAALINHQPATSANLGVSWYDWSALNSNGSYFEGLTNALSLSEKLAMSTKDLLSAPFGQFDLSFTALRDIADGEELYIDYGSMWGESWNNYVVELQQWQEQQEVKKQSKREDKEKQRVGEDAEGGSDGVTTTVEKDKEEEEVLEEVVDTASMPRFRSYIELPEEMVPKHWLRH